MPKAHVAKSGGILFLIGIVGLLGIYFSNEWKNNDQLSMIALLFGLFTFIGFFIMYKGVKIHGRKHGWWS